MSLGTMDNFLEAQFNISQDNYSDLSEGKKTTSTGQLFRPFRR
jgi:hypothetical protein